MGEDLTKIFPDEFVELISRNIARATFLITTRNDRMALASTGVVGIVFCFHLPISTRTRQMTSSATDERTQQVGMRCIVAAGKLLVVSKLRLHQIKLFFRDDGWNLSHRFPLLWPSGGMASVIVTNRSQCRLPMTGSGDTV